MAAGLVKKDVHSASDISLESDIADLRCAFQHEIPPRPNSRLGFNSPQAPDSPCSKNQSFQKAHHDSIQYYAQTLSGGQTRTSPDELEFDITTLAAERIPAQAFSGATLSSLDSLLDGQCTTDETLNSLMHSELDTSLPADFTICKMAEHDDDALPIADSALDSILLSFSSLEDSKHTPATRYSSLPSPFSPGYLSTSRSSHRYPPQRHRYRHHGYSRHSLSYLKWFWATRETFWMDLKSRLPLLSLPSTPTEIQPQPSTLHSVPVLPPLSIHPRRGDLSALRDPYCTHIDRYFVGMPIWTMSKTLWMFDVHMAFGDPKDAALQGADDDDDDDDDLFEEDRDEGDSIETSGSHAFSDDSDSTLVESESEGEADGDDRVSGDVIDCDPQQKGVPVPKESIVGDSDSNGSFSSIAVSDGYDSDFDLSTPSLPASTSPIEKLTCSTSPRWVTCWYRRWEILLHLCIKNNPAFVGNANLFPVASPAKTEPCIIADVWDEVLPDDQEDCEGEVEYPVAKRVLLVVNGERSDSLGAASV